MAIILNIWCYITFERKIFCISFKSELFRFPFLTTFYLQNCQNDFHLGVFLVATKTDCLIYFKTREQFVLTWRIKNVANANTFLMVARNRRYPLKLRIYIGKRIFFKYLKINWDFVKHYWSKIVHRDSCQLLNPLIVDVLLNKGF